MRVVHLVPSVGPLSGGMGVVATALLREQRSSGVHSTLWCVDPPEIARAVGPPGAILPFPVLGPRRFALSRAAETFAATNAAEIVHQHGLWTAQARVSGIFRRRKASTVVAPHGSLEPEALKHSLWKKRIALAAFESRNLRGASCLQATCEAELLTFRNLGLRGPVAVIHNGVAREWIASKGDGEAFRNRHAIPRGRRVMLFLSRIHPKKGLSLLVEALAANMARLGHWELVIAGIDERGHQAEIERQARSANVADLVRFVGPVYDQERRDAYAAADLFVLPTRSENFGLVVAEALGCGVPVLTTHGAPWQDLETHECGWWVPVDSRAIGDALLDATGRPPEELRAMGERGRALVSARYLWPAVAEQTIALYRWLSRGEARPSFVVLD